MSARRARTLVTDGFAPVVEGVFEVTEVRVPEGVATIGALAQLGDGEVTAHDTVDITVVDGAPAIRLLANPRSGTVPLEARLDALASRSFPIERIDFDLDGDRELDVLASPKGTTLAAYADAGPRLARAYFTLPSGAEVSAAVRVNAYLAEEVLTSFATGNPVDLAEAPEGGFYVLDGAAGVITHFDSSHAAVATIGSGGAGSGQLSNPQALAVAPDGTLYVADTGNDRIQVFDADGTHRSTLGSEGSAALDAPRGIALDGDVLAVSDAGNSRVVFLAIDGSFLGEVPIAEPRGIEGVSGYGFVVASPSAGLWAVLPESDRVSARSIPMPEISAPIDITIGEEGILVADAGRARVGQLSARLGFERALAQVLDRPPRAVLGSARREMPSIYVADGERVLEIAQPVPSPLPVVESLKTSLRSGDVSAALSLFEPLQRLVFAEIYDDLGATLQTDADAMGALSIDLLREDRAIVRIEAELPTSTGSETRGFPLYLVREEDGTWQIFDY